MSKVIQITERYSRSVQPKPYESKEAFLEAILVADEGEEISPDEAEGLFSTLIGNVHAALNLPMKGPAEVPVANSTDDSEVVKKNRTRRTKKQIAEDKAKDEAEKAHPALATTDPETELPVEADEVPVDGDHVVDNSGKEVPVDGDEAPGGVSDTDLQSAAAGAAAKHGAAKVKGLMKEFDVTLLGKLDQAKRLEFVSKLDELGA